MGIKSVLKRLHLSWPVSAYYRIKFSIQRVKRGWSDKDTWSFDHYLFGVIGEGMIRLSETTNGNPCGYSVIPAADPPKSCKTCQCWPAWQHDLVEYGNLFIKLADDDYDYSGPAHTMFDKSNSDYEKAMAWFTKWSRALWD